MNPACRAAALLAMLLPAFAAQHPRVYITKEDVARARRNIERYPWAREIAAAIRREADGWVARDDSWFRDVMPKPDAAYAYGLQNCPVCGAGWGAWGLKGASFDRPGRIRCERGHTFPDADHPDPGTGYKAPDGRIHYFVGAYNSFVVETLTFQALENLVYAYTLTGDERYAAKASVILDAVAAIYPGSHKGCWDYPSNPLSGRLNRPWYQASRVLVHYVDSYDQLYNSDSMNAPSAIAGLTRRKNIEDNLLRDGGAYCYEMSKAGRLHNGEADYLRGALAVGLALDIPEYVNWAVDGPFGIRVLIENAIGRDGQYYEITPMYADHTRELFFTFTEPLLNSGLNLYKNPKLRHYFQPHNLVLFGAGHAPRYGDAPPDLERRPPEDRPFDRSDYDFLEKLWVRTGDAVTGSLLNWVAGGRFDYLRGLRSSGNPRGLTIPDRRVRAGMSLYREPGDQTGGGFSERTWTLFHAGGPPPNGELPEEWKRRLLGSHILGQKGLAVLRAGEGRQSQELMLRFGPSLNHTHFDALNINYIARGYELTYDLGYGHSAATQTQIGWAKQTVSHNVVTVDERSQGEGGVSTGSLLLFADSPAVKAVEASAEANYSKQNVSLYSRLVALISSGPEPYAVDIFRVRGGRRHDWSFHALSDRATFSGVELGPPAAGSLAGPDIEWSARQGHDGDMNGIPGKPTWLAPPGNGYGFLSRPRLGIPSGAWSASWNIDPATWLHVHMAPNPGTQVVAATANGLYPHYPKAQYVLARRAGADLESVFVSAMEPGGAQPRIRSIELLPVEGAVLARVLDRDGAADYIYSAPDDGVREASELAAGARFAHARVSGGELASVTLAGGMRFTGFGWAIAGPAGGWRGKVIRVDAASSTILAASDPVTAGAPPPSLATGATIVFRNPAYSQTSAYRVLHVETADRVTRMRLDGTLSLGIGQVDSITSPTTFTSMIPHEYALSDRGTGERGFFRGKQIRTASRATARIQAVRAGRPMSITVDSTADLKAGERFDYLDLQPGDQYEILPAIHVTFRGGRPQAPQGITVRRAP